jgi:hypothetical protein
MDVSTYEHNGQTYQFEPPIDTGAHSPETMAQLVAVAMAGANAAPDVISFAELRANLSLSMARTDGDSVGWLNLLLENKHHVTVVQAV